MKKEKYYWLNEDAVTFLKRGYLLENEDPKKRYREIAEAAEKILGIKGFADEFEEYNALGYYSLSSPIISNFGRERGLPISCFGSVITDSMESIMSKVSETAIMTKGGGGTSAYFGNLRPRGSSISAGGHSTGSVHFMELFDKLMNVVSQGNVRRGSFAAYLPIDHGDIEEFLKIKETGNAIQDLSIGVCIEDKWMESMIEGDKKKRKVWSDVIKKRYETGYPYLFFTDNANNQSPQVYKDKGLRINNSNLCNEVMLSNSEDESFVCDLASMNAERFDSWKGNPRVVKCLAYFLDAVMTEFIAKTEHMKYMEAPRKFAINQRALGIGVLGFHSLLQSKMISFESMQAKYVNTELFKIIREHAEEATKELASLLGEPPLLKGYGRRNTTLIAVAPTTSSSYILGQVSPSIEPLNSNAFTKDLAKIKTTYKNPYLKDILSSKGYDNDDVWLDIIKHGGSVQHLDYLTQEEKDVFKTFSEISQAEIVNLAISRQIWIDQGQSLNTMIPIGTPPKQVSELLIHGWRGGLKGFYYQRSSNPSKDLARSIMNCKSCEG